MTRMTRSIMIAAALMAGGLAATPVLADSVSVSRYGPYGGNMQRPPAALAHTTADAGPTGPIRARKGAHGAASARPAMVREEAPDTEPSQGRTATLSVAVRFGGDGEQRRMLHRGGHYVTPPPHVTAA